MALSELAAIEAAYHALLSLDDAGRGRALRWLSDALDAPMPLAENAAAASTAPDGDTAAVPAKAARVSTRKARRRPTSGDAARRAPRKADPPSAASRRGRRRNEAAASAGERTYRRMPDAEEVLAAYQQVGTVSGLAEYFGVPTHTVQGWARRLRQKGHQIGRQG